MAPAFDRAKTMQLAEKHMRAGKMLEAVTEYKKLAEDNPRDMNVLNKLGDLLARAGKNQDALRYFMRIAEFYSKDGFHLKAIAMYKKIAKFEPGNMDIQHRLAQLYQQQGLSSEAKAQYLHVADQHMRKGQSQPAVEMLQKVLEIEPENVKVRSTLAELLGRSSKGDDAALQYCQMARSAIERGSVSESLQAVRKAVTSNPALPDLPALLTAFLAKHETIPTELVAIAEQVARASARSGLALVAAAEAYRRAGRRPEAETSFGRLAAEDAPLEDLNAEAMTFVSRFHLLQGREAEGYEWLSRAVEAFLGEGRTPQAAATLDEFLKKSPEHRQALSHRAAVAAKDGDTVTEAAHLARLAPLLIAAVDMERAREVVDRLRALSPSDPDVQQWIETLENPGQTGPVKTGLRPAPPEAASGLLRAEEEAQSAGEIFDIEEEGEEISIADESVELSAPDVETTSGIAGLDGDRDEEAYGPVSRIQDIQASDVDGQPIDDEFVSEHLTEAEVFVKYGLLEKAREQVLSILKRYPKHVPARVRLKDIYVNEGNTEQAVRECLALADVKKAEGRDGEMRELVNEAIRIAGPGSPLVERYASDVGLGGSPMPPPVPAAPARPAARPVKSPAAAAPAPVAVEHDLEIEIEMPEEDEAPAEVPDFAVTTARATAIPPAARIVEESPDDLPPSPSAASADHGGSISLDDDDDQGDGEAMLSAIAAAAPARDPDDEKLGEVDFYVEQGLTDEARLVLFQLRKQYPKSEEVTTRLRRLDHPEVAAAGKATGAQQDGDLDFEVEQALGGRNTAAPSTPKSAKAAPKPVAAEQRKQVAPKASKVKPVFKVETPQPSEGGDFFDLGKELDASLDEEQEKGDGRAPESLEGPGHSFEEVFAAFKKGVEQQVDQGDFETHYNLGIAYKEMGLVDEAIGEFQFAARDPSKALECCGILGVCFRDKGMPELALKWYRRGLDMPGLDEQQEIGLRYDMAEVYREKGEYDQALKMYTEVFGVDSTYREVSSRIKEIRGKVATPRRS